MKNRRIGLDTNIFIYQFQGHPQFGYNTQRIFDQLNTNKIKAITSTITLIEVLGFKKSETIVPELQNLLLEVPNLEIKEVSINIALEAARIRRNYNFRLPDAIQIATALIEGADMFITNDTKLQKFKEIKVVSLQKFAKD